MHQEIAKKVLETEARAIQDLVSRIGPSFDQAVLVLLRATGRVVVTGMGKSGLIGQKTSATLASTGTPSLFLHPADALHGDLGRIVKGDVLLILSHSGDTAELLSLVPSLKRLNVPVVALTGDPESQLAKTADVHLDVSIREEACPLGLAPTASTTAALAMGDALAMALLEARGFTVDDFAVLHPGGHIGKKLLRVKDVMHTGDSIPRVVPETKMHDVLLEMTGKRLGMTTVVDGQNHLVGVISDGDLRRNMQKYGSDFLQRSAQECLKASAIVLPPDALAVEALNRMEEAKITSIVITESNQTVLGVVHLHDLWKTQLI